MPSGSPSRAAGSGSRSVCSPHQFSRPAPRTAELKFTVPRCEPFLALVVKPAAQTITFGQPPDATVGAPVTLSASASSGLPVSFRSGTLPVCTVAGSGVTTVAAGPGTITASQGGSARFAAATDVLQSFQVNPVPSKVAGVRVILLAAVILTAAAATMVMRRRRLRSHPPPASAPSVRAVPDAGPPGLVSVHNTGAGTTHTVRIEPSPGTSITTIEEARP